MVSDAYRHTDHRHPAGPDRRPLPGPVLHRAAAIRCPTADTVAAAISRAVQQFGIGGCAGRMAQEFGDHPDAAAKRMRWVRQLIAQRPATQRQEAAA